MRRAAGRAAAAGRAGVAAAGRVFPRGPLDLLWQFAVLAFAYYAWRYARGAVEGSAVAAFANANHLISIERALGTFVEPQIQSWVLGHGWMSDFCSWFYANVHFNGSIAALAFIYFAHNRSYCFVRNTLILAMAISLAGYALYPTAPPRFFGELGFTVDPAVTGNSPVQSSPDPLFNPYAAVPSMHVGFAIIFGFSLALLIRPRPLKAILFLYPVLVTFVVVATGNHFWLDALLGGVAVAAAAAAATALARLRPEAWSFRPRPAPQPAPAGEPEMGTAAA